ncbi:MAG: arsenate reductase ArsC [candidate division Zixibacteria bacterium]|nr:arsenate reductase ArsC [candidate division Zixibacteria bacterium]
MHNMKKVLFVCTGNSCRSQMAEGLLRFHGAGEIEVFSAGTSPGVLNPKAIEVMQELGLDISHQESESIDKYINRQFDYVITVCSNVAENCPTYPGETQMLHWNLDDPAETEGDDDEVLKVFRQIRDEIGEKITGFLEMLK